MNTDLSKAVLDAAEPFARAWAIVPGLAWAIDSDKIGIIDMEYDTAVPLGITVADLQRLALAVEAHHDAQDDERKGGFICVDPGFRNRILEEIAKGRQP